MMTAPPEWLAKAVAAVVSGWVFTALAVTGAIILCPTTRVGEVDLTQIRHDWGGWISVGTILCGALAFVRLAQRGCGWITPVWQRRAERRTRKKAEAETIAYLDTLSSEETRPLEDCLSRGERTLIISEDVKRAFYDGGVYALATKGIMERKLPPGFERTNAVPYTIPTFVWDELQRRGGTSRSHRVTFSTRKPLYDDEEAS